MKLLLIDGNYYVYRSFFAIRNLTTQAGEPVNAIYGFVKTMRKMLKDLQPDCAAVIWDEGLPERRTALQPAYKAQRAEMPADLIPQTAIIRQLVPLLGLGGHGLPGTEADDLIASYAVAAASLGYETILATNDKDLFQLVGPQVQVYSTNKRDLVQPTDPHALLGVGAVLKKWGVEPHLIGDILALLGDTVDNIPGVLGIGPKTATGLMQQFGGLDAMLANTGAIANEKLRARIESDRAQIAQNREMVRLDLDLPLPVPVADLVVRPDYPPLIEIIKRCEFRRLLAELEAEAGMVKQTSAVQPEFTF